MVRSAGAELPVQSFDGRKRSLPGLRISTLVATSSLTVGTPSIMATRLLAASSRRISSRNGAYPLSWETPRRTCLQF